MRTTKSSDVYKTAFGIVWFLKVPNRNALGHLDLLFCRKDIWRKITSENMAPRSLTRRNTTKFSKITNDICAHI